MATSPSVAVAAPPRRTQPKESKSPSSAKLHNVHTPYIPASMSLPEITVKGVILGIILAVLLGAANTYLGLKAGLTVAASIPAAVLSMAVLRLFRKYNILENNMVQTIASAGTSVASGAIFTIPALIILGYWDELEYWDTTFIIIAGGMMGVLFSVPIRRALIVEENLPFPEGRATGEVLMAGEKGGAGVGALILGGALGAAFKVMQGGFRMWKEDVLTTLRLGGDTVMGIGATLSPALLGVGAIIGLRIASLVFLGGVLGWIVGIPLYTWLANDVGTLLQTAGGYEDLPGLVARTRIRYVGVGAMLVGGLWSLVKLRKPLSRAVMQGVRSTRGGAPTETVRTERDLPFSLVGFGSVILAVPMAVLYFLISGDAVIAVVLGLIVLVTGFLFSAVGGYMAGLVGSSNTPISGVTILALLTASLALLAFGIDPDLGPALVIMVAAIIAVAGSISGDNLQDLKAGHMLGSTPRKQQFMIMVGALASSFFIAPVIQILINGASPSAMAPLGTLPAPQANVMAALSSALFSPSGLSEPQRLMIGIGAGLAVALILLDKLLQVMGSTFRTPVMAVAVGIYLPVGLSVPIFIGGLAAWAGERWYARRAARAAAPALAERWRALGDTGGRSIILIGSGLIAGEAILGIVTSFVAANGGTLGYNAHEAFDWLGLAIMAALVVAVYLAAVRPGMKAKGNPPELTGPRIPPPGH